MTGPPPPRGRGRAGRTAAGLLALAVLALGLLATPPLPRGQERTEDEVTFTGVSGTPWVTRDGTWSLALLVEGAPADGQLRAVIRDRLADRAAYNTALFGVVDGVRKAAIPPVDLATAVEDDDGRGKIVPLAVTLLSDAPDNPGWKFLRDGLRPGVYPIEIEVVDEDGTRRGGTIVFLTRISSGDEPGADRSPLLVAPVVPLGAPPSVAADGTTQVPAELPRQARALADGLARAWADDAALPATLAPRPESIEALAREAAEDDDLLDDLRAVATDRQVLDAPYVEVPLAAWVEAQLGDELTRQRVRGNTVLTSRLGPVDSSTFLAPSGLTPAAATELWNVGTRTVVFGPLVTDIAAPTLGPFTISAGEGRSLTAVAADGGLTAALTRWDDPVLDRAGLAAELALLAEGDDGPRGVAVVAPVGWPHRPEDVASLAEVLLAPEAPVEVTTVAGLVAAVPPGPEQALPPILLEDLGDQPDQLRRARSQLASYASMVGPDSPTVAPLDQRLLLSGSAALSPPERNRYIGSVLATTAEGFASVEAPPRQTITLTSSDGTVPLTFRSSFDQPVQVLVEVDAGTRLEFPEGTVQLVTLEPGTTRVPVPVRARAPGDAAVDITLRTPDGVEVLGEVRYTVRSTAIPRLGMFLSIGAGLLLVLWWARHWRAARRARLAT